MGINKYNSEGYYDPTVYEAPPTLEKRRKKRQGVCTGRWSIYVLPTLAMWNGM